MDERDSISQHLPLKPVDLLVLMVLVEGDLHGYGIVKQIQKRSSGQVRLLPGNLYGVIRRMIELGWLAECERRAVDEEGDQRRRYYRITEFGRQVAAAEASRLRQVVRDAEVYKLIETEQPSR